MSNKISDAYLRDLLAYGNIHLSSDKADNSCLYQRLCFISGAALKPADGYISDASRLEDLADPAELLKGADPKTARLLISAVMPLPSKVIEIFNSVLDGGDIRDATDWFYDFCIKSGYIPFNASENNIHWQANSGKGSLHITINTSVPYYNNCHYDYPRCLSCEGHDDDPLRRELPIFLNGEDWLFRFSPYNLFPQHFVFCPEAHVSGKVDKNTFGRLIDAAEYFPHYFFAKNADIKGICDHNSGHECFTGGLPSLPLFNAEPRIVFDDPDAQVKISVLDWYNTVIRLESLQRHALIEKMAAVSSAWEEYSNKGIGILNTKAGRNNGVAPILRINNRGEYCAELVLRNNKLESLSGLIGGGIGAIESCGAFILPGGLAAIAETAHQSLSEKTALEEAAIKKDKQLAPYLDLYMDILKNASGNPENAAADVESYIQKMCEDALRATAVFKENGAGNIALIEFMDGLGFSVAKGRD